MAPLRWTLTENGELRASVVETGHGVLSELDPIDVGEDTDAVELERQFGAPGGN